MIKVRSRNRLPYERRSTTDNSQPTQAPDTPEAAAFLRISRASLYRLVETRQIPFYHVGRGLRFSEEDLQTYLFHNRTGPILN
ncbi:MAG: helix-turn-helix domain-containing protein [Ignavibacteriales bacterium]|nr:helix-turn-helix domain-containing protein [Ignavibacteriales bacterium]